jgi:hypothetical protein
MSSAFPAEALHRLSERIARGEVVFFVGAGFSLDSEGNSAACLVRRLLARLLAMAHVLKRKELVEGLCVTFQLKGQPTGTFQAIATDENVQSLSREYYSINDWCTSAFGLLLEDLKRLRKKRGEALLRIGALEEELRKELERSAKSYSLFPLAADHDRLLALDRRYRGKALFLDTLGFADERVMAGRPWGEQVAEVAESYGGRLRDRHAVLAWLAREGLSRTLVTTNYDLLLEGAYRLASDPASSESYFSRIAAAEEFFSRGAGHRAALIVKLHGCAELYRQARGGVQSWQESAEAMVFTYREIQNWRQDAWSRDFLRSLVRTRTLAFVGYSGGDPVIHDTFRTVYEEMAQRRNRSKKKEETKKPETAPAYFFGLSDKKEFHALEILRAASAAAGCRQSSLVEHPNSVPFYSSGDEERRFPNLDETMLWLFHLTFRQQQKRALQEGLRRTSWLLLGHPGAPAELKAIEQGFENLCASERQAAQSWTEKAACRESFTRRVGWTTRFHTALLQEWALADKVQRQQGPGFDIDGLRRSPWYQPASEHSEWTAWGAVLEIALRRTIAHWRQEPEEWTQDCCWVRPGEGREVPRLLFSQNEKAPTPSALTIRLSAFDRVRSGAGEWAGLRSNLTWNLQPGDLPWSREGIQRPGQTPTPPAAEIWQAAVGGEASWIGLGRFLGNVA